VAQSAPGRAAKTPAAIDELRLESSYDNVNDISSSALGNLGADIRWRLEFE
jgi:translocation and assembly module TamB